MEADDHHGRAQSRFEREVLAAARLRHEGIVRVFDSGIDNGRPYLVMELIEGRTLAQSVRDGASLDGGVRAVAEAAEAVAYAHAQGVLHRDLKPQNVLIARDGRARVVDFGLALDRSRETRITRTGELLGTPAYLAPESARGQLPDERTDVYGLGATLYEVLCRRPPFTGDAAWQVLRAVLDDDPPPPRTLDPAVPWDLEAVCLRALEKHPIHRYPSAASLAEDLRRYLRGDPVLARHARFPGRIRSFVRRNRRLGLGLTAALLFGLGMVAREPGLEVSRTRRARAEEVLARAHSASSLDEEIHLIEEALREDAGFDRARLALGEAHYRRARQAAARGERAGAERALAAALAELAAAGRGARRPIATLAWTLHGQATEAFGAGPEAARWSYEQATRTGVDTPPALFARARLAHLAGDHDLARSLYDDLLRQDAYFALGFARRSELRLAQQDLEGALADAVRAVELLPEAPEPRFARAAARTAAGDTAGALADEGLAARLLGGKAGADVRGAGE